MKCFKKQDRLYAIASFLPLPFYDKMIVFENNAIIRYELKKYIMLIDLKFIDSPQRIFLINHD